MDFYKCYIETWKEGVPSVQDVGSNLADDKIQSLGLHIVCPPYLSYAEEIYHSRLLVLELHQFFIFRSLPYGFYLSHKDSCRL
jgi:hypothetical protein